MGMLICGAPLLGGAATLPYRARYPAGASHARAHPRRRASAFRSARGVAHRRHRGQSGCGHQEGSRDGQRFAGSPAAVRARPTTRHSTCTRTPCPCPSCSASPTRGSPIAGVPEAWSGSTRGSAASVRGRRCRSPARSTTSRATARDGRRRGREHAVSCHRSCSAPPPTTSASSPRSCGTATTSSRSTSATRPDRLLGLGSVPLGWPGAAEEARRCLDELGLAGIAIAAAAAGASSTTRSTTSSGRCSPSAGRFASCTPSGVPDVKRPRTSTCRSWPATRWRPRSPSPGWCSAG